MENLELYSLLSNFDAEVNKIVQQLAVDLQSGVQKASPWGWQGIKDFFKRIFGTKQEGYNFENFSTFLKEVNIATENVVSEIAGPNNLQNQAIEKFKLSLKQLANNYMQRAYVLGQNNSELHQTTAEPTTAEPVETEPEKEPAPVLTPTSKPVVSKPSSPSVVSKPKETKAPKVKKAPTKKKSVKKDAEKKPSIKKKPVKKKATTGISNFGPANFGDQDPIG